MRRGLEQRPDNPNIIGEIWVRKGNSEEDHFVRFIDTKDPSLSMMTYWSQYYDWVLYEQEDEKESARSRVQQQATW